MFFGSHRLQRIISQLKLAILYHFLDNNLCFLRYERLKRSCLGEQKLANSDNIIHMMYVLVFLPSVCIYFMIHKMAIYPLICQVSKIPLCKIHFIPTRSEEYLSLIITTLIQTWLVFFVNSYKRPIFDVVTA